MDNQAPPPYNEKMYPPPGPGSAPYPPPQQQQYPPTGGYSQVPPGMAGQTTVVVTQPVVVHTGIYRGVPVSCQCPHCRAQVVTAVTYTAGLLPWLLCLGLLLIGCWAGCCLIPFCIDDLKDTTHYCPNCKQVLGTYRRI